MLLLTVGVGVVGHNPGGLVVYLVLVGFGRVICKVRYVARYIRKDKSSDRFECRIFTDVQWT